MAVLVMRVTVLMVMIMVVVMAAATALAMGVSVRMRVGMTMVMLVAMIVVVMTVIMMMIVVMVMAVMMRMRRLRIGTALGVEGRLNGAHLPAKALHHRLDHVVAADAQLLAHDLNRQMPVAEMPGEAQQMLRAFGADFRQRLARAHNFHHAPVFELQGVAGAQSHGFMQVEQEIQPTHAFHGEAAAMAIIEIEHHGIGRVAPPISLGDDFRGADHGRPP